MEQIGKDREDEGWKISKGKTTSEIGNGKEASDNPNHGGHGEVDEEGNKVAMVVIAHTLANKEAMVVTPQNAPLACRTMVGSRRSIETTQWAVKPPILGYDRRNNC